jgi:glycosyltransferase involved in cell wall biosynthesis
MYQFPQKWAGIRAALVHDWLTGMRGGERVLEILCSGFPGAPVHSLIHNAGAVSDTINAHPIRTSMLQHIPGIFKNYRMCLPLFPMAVRGMKKPEADLMISTSHCVAKAHPRRQSTRHLCYCFTPMRYVWQPRSEYFQGSPARAILAAPLLHSLRRWDRKQADNVDRFVAISETVRKRIRDAYGRDSDIVYPPVNLDFWTQADTPKEDFDLMVSALVPYKRVDLAVKAYARSQRRLFVVGVGSEEHHLKSAAPENVRFLGWQSDESIRDLYRKAKLLVFPGEEDFGLVPLEAQACGAPVVAYRKGGALETVSEGRTGVFFDQQSVDSLNEAVLKAASTRWDKNALRANAQRFSIPAFITGLDSCINSLI